MHARTGPATATPARLGMVAQVRPRQPHHGCRLPGVAGGRCPPVLLPTATAAPTNTHAMCPLASCPADRKRHKRAVSPPVPPPSPFLPYTTVPLESSLSGSLSEASSSSGNHQLAFKPIQHTSKAHCNTLPVSPQVRDHGSMRSGSGKVSKLGSGVRFPLRSCFFPRSLCAN